MCPVSIQCVILVVNVGLMHYFYKQDFQVFISLSIHIYRTPFVQSITVTVLREMQHYLKMLLFLTLVVVQES